MTTKCSKTTKRGGPCPNTASHSSGLCGGHAWHERGKLQEKQNALKSALQEDEDTMRWAQGQYALEIEKIVAQGVADTLFVRLVAHALLACGVNIQAQEVMRQLVAAVRPVHESENRYRDTLYLYENAKAELGRWVADKGVQAEEKRHE